MGTDSSSESSKRTRIETPASVAIVHSRTSALRANHPREQGLKPIYNHSCPRAYDSLRANHPREQGLKLMNRKDYHRFRHCFERIIQENKDWNQCMVSMYSCILSGFERIIQENKDWNYSMNTRQMSVTANFERIIQENKDWNWLLLCWHDVSELASSESSKRTRIETRQGCGTDGQSPNLRANHPREQGLKLSDRIRRFLTFRSSSESSKRTRIETLGHNRDDSKPYRSSSESSKRTRIETRASSKYSVIRPPSSDSSKRTRIETSGKLCNNSFRTTSSESSKRTRIETTCILTLISRSTCFERIIQENKDWNLSISRWIRLT